MYEGTMEITSNIDDLNDLKKAVELLEAISLTAKISSLIGSPIESLVKKLPTVVSEKINATVEVALHKSADVALWSLDNKPQAASTKLHKLYAAVSGAAGGAFGFTTLFIELPISTTIMMRSVADVARSEGFNLEDLSTRAACIEVFALGGPSKSDDATESGYYATRSFITEAMKSLSVGLAEAASRQGANASAHAISSTQVGTWLAALIETVTARFGITISEKFAAQAVPVIGAAAGAILNTMFTDFYQDMARGHFIVMRLEKKYGAAQIEKEYNSIKGQ